MYWYFIWFFLFKAGTKKGPSHCITVFQGARQLLGCVHSCIFLVLHSSVNEYFKWEIYVFSVCVHCLFVYAKQTCYNHCNVMIFYLIFLIRVSIFLYVKVGIVLSLASWAVAFLFSARFLSLVISKQHSCFLERKKGILSILFKNLHIKKSCIPLWNCKEFKIEITGL